jgi:hypothetical protein
MSALRVAQAFHLLCRKHSKNLEIIELTLTLTPALSSRERVVRHARLLRLLRVVSGFRQRGY